MGKTNSATHPTTAPVLPPPDEVATEPEIAIDEPISSYPAGVSMHDAGKLPNTSDRADRIEPDPKRPPVGWQGAYSSCGGCGDFLGNADRCPKCAPPVGPNVTNNNRGL